MSRHPAKVYGEGFFSWQVSGAERSASVVVPIVLELVQVASVVDVGCGTGVWLHYFKKNGVGRVLGLDGGSAREYGQLRIDCDEFRQINLQEDIIIDERFDLCVCLEVVEHLSSEYASHIVSILCSLSDVVLFSAAVPGQCGDNHINEQWLGYWARLFEEYGYNSVDIVRGRIWNDASVEVWYRQNIILFANSVGMQRISVGVPIGPIDIVHPELYMLGGRLFFFGVIARLATVHRWISNITAKVGKWTKRNS